MAQPGAGQQQDAWARSRSGRRTLRAADPMDPLARNS